MTFFFIDVFLIIGGYFLLKPLFTDSYDNSRYITYTRINHTHVPPRYKSTSTLPPPYDETN